MGRGNGRRNGLALLAWVLLGAGLRFWQLDSKTPWSDEWATLVFSLGRSFETIPLDRLLSLEELLAIARLDNASPWHGLGNVWRYLMAESTHPPLYFWLTHLWLRFWQGPGELVGLGVARSLSALLGVAGIPAAYGLGYWMMAGARSARRHRVALLAAALMALSPFGVYLAQEARHYTLALLWVMASLGCFGVAWRAVRQGRNPPNPPLRKGGSEASRGTTSRGMDAVGGFEVSQAGLGWGLVLLWVLVNGVGLATHYFVGLLVAAEGLALTGLVAVQWLRGLGASRPTPPVGHPSEEGNVAMFWGGATAKLMAVAGGALLAAVPWLPFWLSIPGDRLTEWISQDVSLFERWLMPLLRVGAWLASMVMLLPVEQVPVWLAVLSGVGLLAALLWLLPRLVSSLRHQLAQGNPAVEALLAVQGAGLLLVLAAIYLWQKDLSLATRYFFVFLPGMVLLVAIALAGLNSRRVTVLLLALGFAGSLAVTTGHAFQKPDRPDLFVRDIRAASVVPAFADSPDLRPAGSPVVVTFYKTHEQLGEMLALAWELNRQSGPESYFLVAQRRQSIAENTENFKQALAALPGPFTLWTSNLTMALGFPDFDCNWGNSHDLQRVPGYRYRSHSCRWQE